MCKADEKLWADYWRLQATQDFLAVVSSDMGIPISTLVRGTRGGRADEQGTRIHRRVAYDLAAWLSPHKFNQMYKFLDQAIETQK